MVADFAPFILITDKTSLIVHLKAEGGKTKGSETVYFEVYTIELSSIYKEIVLYH